jgi:protein-tyrosine phosphatase
MTSIFDFHNHLMPGVDDGAQTVAEAEAGVAAFVAHGVSGFVATPHFNAELTLEPDLFAERMAEIDAGWAALTAMSAEKFPHTAVYRGVELLLDVPFPDLSDPRVRINGGRFFLFEFPYMSVPPQSARVISQLADGDYIPILAHPERYRGVADANIAGEWRQAGALLQVNGGSLLGKYGLAAKQVAFTLLERGWVDYLCSDYHARGEPLIQEYEQLLVSSSGAEQANTLLRTNPARILNDERPLPIAPFRPVRRNIWQRVGGLFR